MRRYYHNLTSRYNILFNGTESYKEGMHNLESNFEDDFSRTLPVFLFDKPENTGGISGNMDRTISKSTKLISMHSITIKPEIDPDEVMSAKQKEFYSQHEFNKWVDEAYIYMGKAQFHKHEFDKASQTFSYLLSNFSQTEAATEARIWQARMALMNKRFKEAEALILELEEDENLSDDLKKLLYQTQADYALKTRQYTKAIDPLLKAHNNPINRFYKTRYAFILAQVYQKIGELDKAVEYYNKVIKLNPPYTMTFNAKINMALSYKSGMGERREIEKVLTKMLRDDKNIDYQDQIYFALGNIALAEGEEDKAIEYYKKSVASSAGNNNQLAISNLKLADIYYSQPDYINAQAYYDSAVTVITPDYPGYAVIYKKSTSLTNLVSNLNTIELQDSVQKLAKVPKPELYALIDDMIEAQREEDRQKAIQELESLTASNTTTMQSTMSRSGWYFDNPATVTTGRQGFKSTWGNRQLADNWRRKNKASVDYGEISDIGGGVNEANADTASVKAKSSSKYNREYYLTNIPFTDSAKQASNIAIRDALYETGNIYYNDLKDYDKAVDAYEELLRRFPSTDKKLSVYYNLYNIGKETNNTSLTSIYKQRIMSEYPNSLYAKALKDPNFFKQLEAQEKEIVDFYNKTYDYFERGNHSQVVSRTRTAMEKYQSHKLFPNFEYMNIVSTGKNLPPVTLIQNLEDFVQRYPGEEVIEHAKILITYLTEEKPDAAKAHKTQLAKKIFNSNVQGEQYVIISIKSSSNVTQLVFNVITFNLEYFMDNNLDTRHEKLDANTNLCVIKKFKNADVAKQYTRQLAKYPELWRDVNESNGKITIITPDNFNKLKETGEIAKYVLFYEENY
ncbi:MAG: tetratricopeptide repeat protein [Bacteroidales bacterium]|nr:tetratricopeptide repeat protein [Bacteroidales bacterium]